jgi:hypothetical protein
MSPCHTPPRLGIPDTGDLFPYSPVTTSVVIAGGWGFAPKPSPGRPHLSIVREIEDAHFHGHTDSRVRR